MEPATDHGSGLTRGTTLTFALFALALSLLAEAAFFLQFETKFASFVSDFYRNFSLIGLVGLYFGIAIGGAIQGSSHGGGTAPMVFLIATPINTTLFTAVFLAGHKAYTASRR